MEFNRKYWEVASHPYSDVTIEKREYIWEPVVPLKRLVCVTGPPGVNKSSFALTIAARLSQGQDVFGQPYRRGAQPVLAYHNEDDAEEVYRRLVWAGAKQARVFRVNHHVVHGQRQPVTFERFDLIEDDIKRHKPRLVIFDMLKDYFGDLNLNNTRHVARVIESLEALARTHSLAVVGILHSQKKITCRADWFEGSKAFEQRCKRVWGLVNWDPEEQERLLVPVKANFGAPVPARSIHVETAGEELRIRVGELNSGLSTEIVEEFVNRRHPKNAFLRSVEDDLR